jgi:predicted MFS family arabinose efflux permease
MMSLRSTVSLLLFILGIAAMLLQLWFSIWSAEIFIKLMITISSFFVVTIVLTFVGREAQRTRNLENGNDTDH